MKLYNLIFLSSLSLLALSACQTMPKDYGKGDPVAPMSQKEKILSSARSAAIEQQYTNLKKGELSAAELAYRAAPKNPDSALDYARVLRKVDMVEQADMVLKPFAINKNLATDAILVEYAKIQLKQGDFEAAQMFSQEAFVMSGSAQSQMVLGVSVDAQGHHEAAENHFKQALNKVGMDMDLKNAISNNLALCLMAQGKTAEAEKILGSINVNGNSLDSGIIHANHDLSKKL